MWFSIIWYSIIKYNINIHIYNIYYHSFLGTWRVKRKQISPEEIRLTFCGGNPTIPWDQQAGKGNNPAPQVAPLIGQLDPKNLAGFYHVLSTCVLFGSRHVKTCVLISFFWHIKSINKTCIIRLKLA
jgi:hypothetical protein